jgi:hypothetical protein
LRSTNQESGATVTALMAGIAFRFDDQQVKSQAHWSAKKPRDPPLPRRYGTLKASATAASAFMYPGNAVPLVPIQGHSGEWRLE